MDRQAALPVFEVLNLIGLLSLQQRKAPEICELNDKLHHHLAVNTFLRKPSELKLEHPHGWTPTAPVGESNPYRFETGKSRREATPITSTAQAIGPPRAMPSASMRSNNLTGSRT